MVWGFLGSLAGALIGKKSADKARSANEGMSEEQMAFQREQADREYTRQKEFAQMGIRWKSDDARAAGLHPLAAIGGTGATYSPIITAGSGPPYNEVPTVDYQALGKAAGDFIEGQNTKRAQVATATQQERELETLTLERARLQNRLLEAQITSEWANVMGQPSNPPMPAVVGAPVAPVGAYQVEPAKVISRSATEPSNEAGPPRPGYVRYQTSDRTFIDVPSSQLAESFEAMPPGSATASWLGRQWDRYMYGYEQPKSDGLRAGQRWEWSPWTQSWRVVGGYPSSSGRRVGRPDNVWHHR